MELRQLQYFVAVAEALNFRKAAERVHVTQPSISQQVRELEQELGLELFVRDRKSVHLTETGRQLLDKAKSVLALVGDISELASRVNRGQTGTINIGVDMGLAPAIQLLASEFARQFPHVEVQYHDNFSTALNQGLRIRDYDVAIVRPPIDSEHLNSEHIFHEHFVVIMSKSSPLAKRKVLRVGDLVSQVLLLPNRTQAINRKVLEWCRESGFSPTIRYTWTLPHEAGSVLVESGKGVYVVPAVAFSVRMFSNGVAAIPLDKQCSLAVHVAWRKGESAVAILNFVETARRVFRRASSPGFSPDVCSTRHCVQ